MFGWGKVRCWICLSSVSKHGAATGKDRTDVAVCPGCYARWEQERTCADCRRPVLDEEEIGAFLGRQALGHVTCGAIPIVPDRALATSGAARAKG